MGRNFEEIDISTHVLMERVARIIISYLSNKYLQISQLPLLIEGVGANLRKLHVGVRESEPEPRKPTRDEINKSITPSALVSFLDRKPYAVLKRHLTAQGLTFDEYKSRFGLPHDYPSVAAEYSVSRRKIAIDAGLGRKIEGSADRDVWPATSDATPRRRGRPRKVPR